MSTVFPLTSGTFGPIANLFSICALVKNWRVGALDGGHIKDPKWCVDAAGSHSFHSYEYIWREGLRALMLAPYFLP